MYEIKVFDLNGTEKAAASGVREAVLAWSGAYEEGDEIRFTLPEENQYYMIKVDDVLEESFIYSITTELTYKIPFAEKKDSMNQKAFTGERHYLTVRTAREDEVKAYKNLARNASAQHEFAGYYPFASANVETRGESVFAAKNAIDGVVANLSHGKWPYASWGINMQDDAEFKLEFGRLVDIDRIVLYTRADFPHDNWWTEVTFTFSDGTQETVSLEKRIEGHELAIQRKNIAWLTFGNLIKADDPSPFPALTQIEVYGWESEK